MAPILLGLSGCGDTILSSRINPIFGPGPFSVNELEERFGKIEPLFVRGEHDGPGGRYGGALLQVRFQPDYAHAPLEIEFLLFIDTDQTLDEIDVKQIDRSQPMKVYKTFITEGDWVSALPWGIRPGDSYREVLKAYPEKPYSDNFLTREEFDLEVCYVNQGEAPGMYDIWYTFNYEGLSIVTIKWQDSCELILR